LERRRKRSAPRPAPAGSGQSQHATHPRSHREAPDAGHASGPDESTDRKNAQESQPVDGLAATAEGAVRANGDPDAKKSRRRKRSGRGRRPGRGETPAPHQEEVEAPFGDLPDSAAAPPIARGERPETADREDLPSSGFSKMGLSPAMLRTLHEVGYLDPTPIQEGLIPRAMAGVDVMGQARTGTGKTAAFAIPILERLDSSGRHVGPQGLVLTPTRELAVQVRDEIIKLAAGRRAHVVAVYGGKPIREQTEKLRRGVDVLVGTPGRMLDHIARGNLSLAGIRFAVLDEADRMLDIGFRPDIEKILRRCPRERQTLLLSATIPPPVERLARSYMREPETLNFSPTDVMVETIEQHYFTVDPEQKFDLLVRLMQREQPAQAIIFCRTRRGTERIGERLARKLSGVAAIHGDLQQRVRDRVMAGFRQGEVRYLVATDVVGRGIDVTSISHIINYDIPEFCDDYVHRVGRTGRMGREGVAYTFVTPEEGNELTRIEMRINLLLKRDEMPGMATFSKPQPVPGAETETGDAPPEPPKAKPVFGRRQRRTRRAL
jgi:ATP-dependent RNA helicase DeaD